MPGLEDDEDPDLEMPEELETDDEDIPAEESEDAPPAGEEPVEVSDDDADPLYAALYEHKLAKGASEDDAKAFAQAEYLKAEGVKDEQVAEDPTKSEDTPVPAPVVTVTGEDDEESTRWEWNQQAQDTLSRERELAGTLQQLDKELTKAKQADDADIAAIPALKAEVAALEERMEDDDDAALRKEWKTKVAALAAKETSLPLRIEKYNARVEHEKKLLAEHAAVLPKARAIAIAKEHASEYSKLRPHIAVYARLIEEGKTAGCNKLSDVLALIADEQAKSPKPVAKAPVAPAAPPRKVLGWAEVKKRMAPVAKVSSGGRSVAASAPAAKPKALTEFDKLAEEDPTVRAVRNHTKSILESLKKPAVPAKKVEKK